MKKFLAITLALVMTFAMVACGGTSSSTPASTPASGTGAAEPAAEGGEIVIGCLQDITGATSALGMSVQAGAQAAVDEINAAGGIGGVSAPPALRVFSPTLRKKLENFFFFVELHKNVPPCLAVALNL